MGDVYWLLIKFLLLSAFSSIWKKKLLEYLRLNIFLFHYEFDVDSVSDWLKLTKLIHLGLALRAIYLKSSIVNCIRN